MRNAPRKRHARPLLTAIAGATLLSASTGCPFVVGNLRACVKPDGGFCYVPIEPDAGADGGREDGGVSDGGDAGESDGGDADAGGSDAGESDAGQTDGGDGG